MVALENKDIALKQAFGTKEEAITAAGQLLVEQGYVDAPYIEKMKERDAMTSTFIGNMVAIPHGTDDSRDMIKNSGIVLLQVPDGVSFDGNEVKVLIGIAGADGEHMDLLSSIAIVCSEEENVAQIVAAESKQEIIAFFEGSESA
ncbi:PTS sugar transporter subunit IIA [Listeria booriae]|uniref:PTS sugar transporter subunit IIA n=1 Tax=Listeria booriae TaxID=1552123 RepID=UPI00162497E3|nr:PTS sugar transporter subunit IIA [Listeria booriae]MBC1511903.1 PTS sugar transporter subunit IIA [Listeria booriae]MBC6150985.1 PTS sugar transporter subunit IIA [Listeria booriae]MBC6304949.1 PTS sugar transporter subunit IIA [Listeria booriae]